MKIKLSGKMINAVDFPLAWWEKIVLRYCKDRIVYGPTMSMRFKFFLNRIYVMDYVKYPTEEKQPEEFNGGRETPWSN